MKRTIALTLALSIGGSAILYLFSIWIGHKPRVAGALTAIYCVAVWCAAGLLIRIAKRQQQ